MKLHTDEFKENIKTIGRELDSKITYEINDVEYELGSEQLNSVTPHYESTILKSVMKQLDIDSNVEIPKGTVLNYQFGIKVNNEYEYVNYGNYVVYSVEKQEDTNSYKLVCYDKMLYTMQPYEKLPIEYPITIRNYINAICVNRGLVFKNVDEEFVNYDKTIQNELYLDEDGNSLEYTFRDVLDELAQVTASIICINEETDELEVRYINETNDTIDEHYLKDINVNFGEKYGPINTVVLSRSAGADKIALSQPENLPNDEKNAIEISDNQILNFNNRDEFLPAILNKLYGLEYYLNDFASTGIVYYNLYDKYNIKVGDKFYPCIMFNDEVQITTGLVENVYTDMPEGTETDYSKTDKTDRTISKTTLIVDKQARNIEALVYDMYDENGKVNENYTNVIQDLSNITANIQNSGGTNLLLNSVMFSYIDDEILNWEITGSGNLDIIDSHEAKNAGGITGHVFILNNMYAKQRISVKADNDTIPEEEKTYYTFSTKIKKDINGTCYVKIFNNNEEHIINIGQGESPYYADYEITSLLPKDNYYDIEFYGSNDSNATFTDNMFTIGKYKKQWTQANGEIMNTQVAVDINGLHVRSATNEGTEVIITPFEFSGYAKVDGVQKKIFTLNGATTEVEKIRSRSEINMPPLKIVPITTGSRTGWAFVPTSGGDN